MSRFISNKEFWGILKNKKRITFKWPQEFEEIVSVVPTLVDGKRIYYLEDDLYHEGMYAVFEGGLNKYLEYFKDGFLDGESTSDEEFEKKKEIFDNIIETCAPSVDRLGCIEEKEVYGTKVNHAGEIDTWYIDNISMFGKIPTWFDPEFTIHSKLIGDDYEIYQISLKGDIEKLDYKIEIFDDVDNINESFIYEKLENNDKLKLQDMSTKDATHIIVKRYKDNEQLFDIKQETEEDDDLHFYVRIDNGKETFEYSRKIETQQDFIKALEQTISALENYNEFSNYKDDLIDVLNEFN